MNKDTLVYTHGFVGRPEVKDTSKGKVLTFGLGRSSSYDEGAPVAWLSVEVWNEDLQTALADITKGDKVAVVGFLHVREWEGKEYRSLRATQVGKVEFIKRTNGEAPKAAAKTTAKAKGPVTDPDDLGF